MHSGKTPLSSATKNPVQCLFSSESCAARGWLNKRRTLGVEVERALWRIDGQLVVAASEQINFSQWNAATRMAIQSFRTG